jgi:prophage tail gpP-like protein
MALQIHRYTVSGATFTKADVLADASNVRFDRGVSGTDQIEFIIARDHPKLSEYGLGVVIRVHDTDTDTDLAAGIISGQVDLGTQGNMVRLRAEGLFVLLSRTMFPPEYILSGDISSAANKARLTQQFDWRRVTATAVANFDRDEVVSFQGGSGASGVNSTAILTNALLYDLAEAGEAEDNMGALIILGTVDNDGDGQNEGAPYFASGLYESPFYDFKTAPTAFDSLRIGSRRPQLAELEVQVETYTTTGTRAAAAGGVTVADPDGVGLDLSSETARQYVEVKLELLTLDTSATTFVEWFEIIARRALNGISAGTFGTLQLEDNLNVGGQTSLRALDQISQIHGYEYRVNIDGTVDFQQSPATATTGVTFGSDRRGEFTLVEGLHLNILEYVQDDSELANYVFAQGVGQGSDKVAVAVQDTTSQATYGVRQTVLEANNDTITGLKTVADTHLATFKDPRKAMRVEVLKTPRNTWDFVPSDLITVHSRWNKDHSGNFIDEDMRIVRDSREETDNGVVVTLDLESRGPQFFEDTARERADVAARLSESVERQAADTIQTETLSDSNVHTYEVPLDFSPYDGYARVQQVFDANALTWYNSLGGAVEVEVVYWKFKERAMVIAIKRVSGAVNFRAEIFWQAWGRAFTGSILGGR